MRILFVRAARAIPGGERPLRARQQEALAEGNGVHREREVKVFIRGWIGYFRPADMKRALMSWDEWLCRRFRMYIWKQWEKPKTKVANLTHRRSSFFVVRFYWFGSEKR